MAYRKHREEEEVKSMTFRIPVWLYDEIARMANANRRSKGAEIAELLEAALEKRKQENLEAADRTPDYGKPNGTDG